MSNLDLLAELAAVLEARKRARPEDSYVASLYAGGTEAILDKIVEEASEVTEAARTSDADALVHEVADLWFHSLVLLAHRNLRPDQVLRELERRFGRSGLQEKASRGR